MEETLNCVLGVWFVLAPASSFVCHGLETSALEKDVERIVDWCLTSLGYVRAWLKGL